MSATEHVYVFSTSSVPKFSVHACVSILIRDVHQQSSDLVLSFEPGVSDVFLKEKTDEAVCWRVRDGCWLVTAAPAAAAAVSAGGDVTATNQRCQRRRMSTVFHYRPLLSPGFDRRS